MKNDRTKTIFYLDLKHVHKYGSAKFQPNPLFSSQQMATENAVEEKKIKKLPKKKSWQVHRGYHQGTGCPNYKPVIAVERQGGLGDQFTGRNSGFAVLLPRGGGGAVGVCGLS